MNIEQMKLDIEEYKNSISKQHEGLGVFVLIADATGQSCWSTNMLHSLKVTLEAVIDNMPKPTRLS